MNILVTTFALLLVLSIGGSIFWKDAISSSSAIMAIKGFYEAGRMAQNKAEQKRFSRWKDATNASSKKQKGTALSTKSFVSHRNIQPPLEQGRLHIAPLWQEEHRQLFQGILETLVKNLYGHTTWYNETLAKSLIQQLADLKDGYDEIAFIEKLDQPHYALWYHIAKGTQGYAIENHSGYPPLTDYLDFSASTSLKHTCYFAFASIPVLDALFGSDVTKKILEAEQTKWEEDHRHHFCRKKELLSLLGTNRQGGKLTNFVETYCFFGQSVGRRSFVQGEDSTSKMSKRISLHQNPDPLTVK